MRGLMNINMALPFVHVNVAVFLLDTTFFLLQFSINIHPFPHSAMTKMCDAFNYFLIHFMLFLDRTAAATTKMRKILHFLKRLKRHDSPSQSILSILQSETTTTTAKPNMTL